MNQKNISVFDVTLESLKHEKIQLVRVWRTDWKISQYMGVQIDITPEMQERWFDSINNKYNAYYIIKCDNKDLGLVNIKNIDYENKSGEVGIFIYNEEFNNRKVSYKSYIGVLDYGFNELNLSSIVAHILPDNIRSIKFHQKFGFAINKGQENQENQLYTLVKSEYLIHRKSVVEIFNC